MEINYTHLQVLYDLLAMQQQEIRALTERLVRAAQPVVSAPSPGEVSTNGHAVTPVAREP